ncbi:MAG: OmpA family protein, partial [Cytophagales bacterium]
MRYRILIFLAFLLTIHVFAQSSKQIKKMESEAEAAYNDGHYELAAELYHKLESLDPKSAFYNYQLATCYFNTMYVTKSLDYFQKAKELGYHAKYLNYYIGRSHHFRHHMDSAIHYYKLCFETAEEKEGKKVLYTKENLEKLIKQAESGKKMIKDSLDVKIVNVGKVVNSDFADYSPVVTADETELIFTSRRPGSTGGMKDKEGKYFEDIYISVRNSKEDPWGAPQKMQAGINTDFHDAAVSVSPDGSELYIYRDGPENNGDIMVSTLSGRNWSNPKRLNDSINSPFWEPSASISPDRKFLIFASDRPGGYGGTDLYIAEWIAGDWRKIRNMGSEVNTIEDEDAPYFHPDGRTIFFSSKGHNGMGGFDIFKTHFDPTNKKCYQTQNVGYPISTADDDIFFACATDGKSGYFASYRSDSRGDKDIYKYTGDIFPSTVYVLNGFVYDSDNGNKPMLATIRVMDLDKKQVVRTIKTNSATGKFVVLLDYGKNYGIDIDAEGKLFYSENIYVPDYSKLKEVTAYFHSKDVYLKKLFKGNKLVLRNVLFDKNQSVIKPESALELDKLVSLMKENPEMIIEVSGHTDEVGSDLYNMKLSDDRANAVSKYLVNKGISEERIAAIGYGEQKPFVPNDTEGNRKLNRRTEVEIVELNLSNFLNADLISKHKNNQYTSYSDESNKNARTFLMP